MKAKTWFGAMWRGAVVALALVPAVGAAQGYPNKAVRVVLPYPPGGPTDIVARVVAQKLSESLGQSFVVENRPGATGMIGTDGVARAQPDGYTLLVNASVQVIYPNLFAKLNFDPIQDFAAVSELAKGPLALVVNPELPVNSVQELIALSKSRPGGLSFGSSGNGGATHLSGEAFRVASGADIHHVAYKGSAPALNDIVGGHVDMMFDSLASSGPFVQAGRLRALAVTTATRSAVLPDVPSVAEAGVPGYDISTWYGMWAPAGTPVEIVELLSAEVAKVFNVQDVHDHLATLGLEVATSSPAEFTEFTRSEQQKWSGIVQQAGVQAQ